MEQKTPDQTDASRDFEALLDKYEKAFQVQNETIKAQQEMIDLLEVRNAGLAEMIEKILMK